MPPFPTTGPLYGDTLQQAIRFFSHRYGVDPRVPLAVAPHEGGFQGSVGDKGTSFGPFQLHITGALPAGKDQTWAQSAPGVEYAIRQGAGQIKGLSGPAAVEQWVRRFEIPAQRYLPTEIANSIATYRQLAAAGGGAPVATAAPQPVGAPARAPTARAAGPRAAAGPTLSTGNPALVNWSLSVLRGIGSGSFNPDRALTRLMTLMAAPQAPPPPARTPLAAGTGSGPSRAPAGAPAAPARVPGASVQTAPIANYPLAIRGDTKGSRPYFGSHRDFGNWQSDNAVDIYVPIGTPVYAMTDGTIGSQIGSFNSSNPALAGLRVNLFGTGNNYYYAHLSQLAVHAGQKVKRGQLLGYSGEANGAQHLHFAQEHGTPMSLFQGR